MDQDEFCQAAQPMKLESHRWSDEESMLTAELARGRVEIWRKCKPTGAETKGDRIVAVRVLDLETGAQIWVRADYVLDATELGDVLALAGVDYVSGAESSAETGEFHAPDSADPENVQALTWCSFTVVKKSCMWRMIRSRSSKNPTVLNLLRSARSR